MKAIVLTGIRKIELVERPAPALQHPTDILLKIMRVGICGSDLHYYTQGQIGNQIVSFPYSIGHECSAVVTDIGKQATRFKPGDLVVVDPSVSCGVCDQCRLGHYHTCRKVRFLGCPGQLEGCLGEFLVMPEDCCYSARGLSADQAALVEPLTIGYYAVQLSGDLKGKKIGILGSGPIGLSVLLTAKAAGASAIYMTDRLDYRLDVARQQGAAWTGNPDRTDIVADIIQREPLELDVVFECCGQQTAFEQAMKLCKPMGRIVIVGIPETDQSCFPVHDARRKGLTFINVRRQNECIDHVIDLINEGRIRPDFMITHRFGMDQAARAFELLAAYGDGIIKAIVDVN
ncbi:MAG: alcohol dehydrogenase catalytic domain-containing protein [Acidobacteria bacterium]|nr:alcohol dehydrogenase catalytic domain-containing protein [Acidobacteriota bacterium]